jgi:ubiquinone/menaquinone biosynthesis C-methylase UbiE
MTKKLLNEAELEWSAVVANNSMNRERKATGVNSYEKDCKLNPFEFIKNRKNESTIHWIDLCCGKGNALIEVAKYLQNNDLGKKTFLKGIDLVDYFGDYKGFKNLTFETLNLSKWQPECAYDLITMVHGLHYVGDKIGLIIKAASTLKKDGIFMANLDIKNIEITNSKNTKKALKSYFDESKINYNARTKMLTIIGAKNIENRFSFIGADDKAGINYTGQSVVDSFYSILS